MRDLRVGSLALACALASCTHDFDLFEPRAELTPPADAAPGDAASSDSAPPSDAASFDSGPIDASGCAEPGATVFMGHCYFPTAKRDAWAALVTACAAANAHLVTIGSAAEESAVAAIAPTEERWIGLSRPRSSPSRDASFAWIDGEPRTFSDWEAGEPNGSGECVRLRTSGQWADNVCTFALLGICERE